MLRSFILLVILSLFACSYDHPLVRIVDDYYNTYRVHDDFNSFMDFYSDSVVMDDVLLDYHLQGRDSLRLFFDWANPKLQILDSIALEFDKPLIQDSIAVISGHFTKFSWDSEIVERMDFITKLEFNADSKIIKHTDWIDYPVEWLR